MQLTKAIITAMKEEADIIIEKYNLKEIEEKSIPMGVKIFEGTRSSVDDWDEKIVLLLAGIWKVAATMATTYLFENYDVFKLINIGIAWNISDDDIKVWDVFIPNTFIKHDLHLPFDGDHLDYIKKPIFLESSVWENYDLQKFMSSKVKNYKAHASAYKLFEYLMDYPLACFLLDIYYKIW